MLSRATLLTVAVVGLVEAQAPITVAELKGTRAMAIHALLSGFTRDSGYSGAVVAIMGDSSVLRAGYGYANREDRIPFTTSTVAQIGSITKQFTATAVVDLHRRHLLRFDDSIGHFIQAPSGIRAATIDQLLQHRAGLQEYCGQDLARAPKPEFLSRCLAQKLIAPPGTKNQYSNPGFALLAVIVEQVSGKPIDDYLRERFFVPLGLKTIGYDPPGIPRSRFAFGYKDGVNRGLMLDSIRAVNGDFWNLKGNGGMEASADDMVRWLTTLWKGGGPIDSTMRADLLSPREQRDSTRFFTYGLGVRNLPNGHHVYSFSGSDGVFYSTLAFIPEESMTVYTVANSGENPMTRSIASQVVRLLRGQ